MQMSFTVAGVSIAVLIFGIVEAAKEFGVTGKWSQVLALFLGMFFVGLSQAIGAGMIPATVLPWVELVVTAIAGGLAAMGYYDFSKRFQQ